MVRLATVQIRLFFCSVISRSRGGNRNWKPNTVGNTYCRHRYRWRSRQSPCPPGNCRDYQRSRVLECAAIGIGHSTSVFSGIGGMRRIDRECGGVSAEIVRPGPAIYVVGEPVEISTGKCSRAAITDRLTCRGHRAGQRARWLARTTLSSVEK